MLCGGMLLDPDAEKLKGALDLEEEEKKKRRADLHAAGRPPYF